jgi:hypothetical protein
MKKLNRVISDEVLCFLLHYRDFHFPIYKSIFWTFGHFGHYLVIIGGLS